MPIQYRRGDLLAVQSGAICHQCNCVTKRGKGLSAAVHQSRPWSNLYERRGDRKSVPGTVVKDVDPEDASRVVYHLIAQRYPGKARYANDTVDMRTAWFRKCLAILALDKSIKELHFPNRIGCGLAGGNWAEYRDAIIELLGKKNVVIWSL